MSYTDKFLELNPPEVPMVETGYYAWLSAGGYTGKIIEDNVYYLETLGFILGADTVSPECVRALRWIHDQYFRNVVAPAL